MIFTNHNYTILHDNGLPLCFVGDTLYNHMLYTYWKDLRPCLHVTVEEAETHTQDWFDQHQFICIVSNVAFKRTVVEKLSRYNPHYFSVVGSENNFNHVDIGVGTFIQHYNIAIWNNIKIGDYCTVTSYNTLGHDTTIDNFCHVSAYCFLTYTTLQPGNLLAIRSSFLGRPDKRIDIAPNCNFMCNSTVTKNVTKTGTYFGHKMVSQESSLTYKIL